MAARSRRRKRAPKTISPQGVTGQLGINLIERAVLEMGSRWTPSGPNEIGIDGYIELFDPNSHLPLGRTVAVQSKVVTALTDDSNPAFDYWCDANDVEYWLNGNTPVILVVSSPASNEAFWISVGDHFKGWTPADSTRVTFVRQKHRLSQDSFRLLVSIAAPEQGLYLAPTRHQENLHTNLLLLQDCPARIFIGGTDCRTPREVWALLRATKQELDAGWALWERKIFSFHDLREKPWSSVCEPGTIEAFSTSEWSESNESHRQRIFVQLLNQTLKAQLHPDVRYWPQEDSYAIAGQPRRLSYQSLRRSARSRLCRGFPRQQLTGGSLNGSDIWLGRLPGPKPSLFTDSILALRFGQFLTFSLDVGIIDRTWLSADPDFARDTELSSRQLLIPDFDDGVD